MGRLVVGALRRKADRWWRQARRRRTSWLRKGRAPEAKSRSGGDESSKRDLSYADWISRDDTLREADRTSIRSHITTFTRTPRLSVLLSLHGDAPGYGGVAGHVHLGAQPGDRGYFNRLNLTHNLSCVTAACLATRREVYDGVGGFDERLAVESNDVDFCIPVREAGYRIIWTPFAELTHHERASRKDLRRLPAERAYTRERWGPILDADPFYNPNLALDRKAFQLAKEPRVNRPWLRAGAPAPALPDRPP